MSTERAFIICQQRNSLLSSLCIVSPGSVRGEDLFLSMLRAFPDYTRTLCVKDLFYLEEKGYVVRKNPLTRKPDTTAEWGTALWSLTASGNEIANDLIDDPALEA